MSPKRFVLSSPAAPIKESPDVDVDGLHLLKNSPPVLVKVGSCGDFWYLPQDLLMHHSTLFLGALKGNFSEAIASTVSLTEDDPLFFEKFVRFLYVGDFSPTTSQDSVDFAVEIVALWIMGDKLGCMPFCDKALECLILYHRKVWVQQKVIALAYARSPASSNLCRYLVAQFLVDSINGRPNNDQMAWSELAREYEDFGAELAGLVACQSYLPLTEKHQMGSSAKDQTVLGHWTKFLSG